MNYPIKINNQKSYLKLFFLLEQYKSISICDYFTSNKLTMLWFIYNYSLVRNYSAIFSTKLLHPVTALHTIWLANRSNKSYTLIIKKTSNINYVSILPCFLNKHSFKKLYITTSCYNINKLVLSNYNIIDNVGINTLLYSIKLLRDCSLFFYTINLQYLQYFNALYNLPLIRQLGSYHNNLLIGTKQLTNHVWCIHNLKNL